jgi:hypothetical protein
MKNDHIVREYYFNCETDEYALSEAQSMLGEHSRAEVWRGVRLIGVELLEIPAAKPDDTSVEFIAENGGGAGGTVEETRQCR